jgi:hypothetical protein
MQFTTVKKVATRTATVVGALVITASVGSGALGIAQAATENVPNNSVTSAKIVNGTIQGIDIKDATISPGDLQIRIRPRFAHVSANSGGASILQARGVSTVSRISTGQYGVTFSESVANCGWTATLTDDSDGSASPGEIAVELNSSADPKTLRVRTYNSAGTLTDQASGDGFTVRVDCP